MRRYEGLLSEEREKYINMTWEERDEYDKLHPELFEAPAKFTKINMTVEEICEKYDLVDATDFFTSIGVKLDDI